MVFEISESLLTWDAATGRRLSANEVKCSVTPENLIAPDGQTVALADGDVRDVVSGKERLQTTSGRLEYPFAFSADGHLLGASADRASWKDLAVYELLTGRLLQRLEAPIGWSSHFVFSPDGRLMVAASADALHVWQVSTGRQLLHLPAEGHLPAWSLGTFATALAIAPDGRTAATGHEDGTILLWDLRPAWRQLVPHAAPALTAVQNRLRASR